MIINRNMITTKAKQLIKHHEGVARHPYRDSVDKITIGVGRNLSDRGLTMAEIDLLFETDFALAEQILDVFLADWRDLPEQLQTGLLSMAFNLGGPRLHGFQKMRAAIRNGDFAQAADEALDSKWAKQVGRRADEIAEGFRKAAHSRT